MAALICACGAPLSECPDCDGTGRVGPEGESWKHWMDLPLHSAVAVVAGIVRPSPCPACKGGGRRYCAPPSPAASETATNTNSRNEE